MTCNYVVYKRYEKRMVKGKFPEIITMYLSESLPHIELTRNIDEATTFNEIDAKKTAFITCMSYKKKN